MNTRRIAAFLLLMLPVQMLSGCFAYQSTSAPAATPKSQMRVRFHVPTAVHTVSSPVVSATINNVHLVDARIAWIRGDTVRLTGVQRIDAPGDWSKVTFEQAAFLRTDSASYSAYRFSAKRTAVAALSIGVVYGALMAVVASGMQLNMQMR